LFDDYEVSGGGSIALLREYWIGIIVSDIMENVLFMSVFFIAQLVEIQSAM
jgi:hypothetical protein